MRFLVLASAIVVVILAAGCGGSDSPEPSTDADAAIEQSQRELLRECLADPEACGSSKGIKARLRGLGEVLRDCIPSDRPEKCLKGEVVQLTPKLIASCVEKADPEMIESFGRRAIRPGTLSTADLRELMRVCHAGSV